MLSFVLAIYGPMTYFDRISPITYHEKVSLPSLFCTFFFLSVKSKYYIKEKFK